jgi:hypothetical protein
MQRLSLLLLLTLIALLRATPCHAQDTTFYFGAYDAGRPAQVALWGGMLNNLYHVAPTSRDTVGSPDFYMWIKQNESPGVKFLASTGHLFSWPVSASTLHSDSWWPNSRDLVALIWQKNSDCGHDSTIDDSFRPAFILPKLCCRSADTLSHHTDHHAPRNVACFQPCAVRAAA